ncbi:MAG: hypothetical protein CHACPFDD_01082 [Phycisphaerae bacterium]|nr:hypothetical protein [Phycisphaerae bacterium]
MHHVGLLALLMSLSSCPSLSALDASPTEKPKVAVFTFSGGFKHSSLELAEKTIRELGEKSGAFNAVLHEQYKQEPDKLDLSKIRADYLKQFGAIVFYTTSGPKDLNLLSERQRNELMAAIRSGIGFVGVHSATDTFYQWPEYGEMLGAYFDGHPWNANAAPVTIKVEDEDHAATSHLGASWFIQDEIYQFKTPYDRAKLHVLLSLDTKATDMTLPGIKRTDGDFAIAWTKLYGKGRVFYTALGHREDVWTNEHFQKHLLGGIRWALCQAKGKPSELGAAEEKFESAESGLKYRDLVVGTGAEARPMRTVATHYTGWLIDGTKFDSSLGGEPIRFTLGGGEVIRGWDEGVTGMKVGGKRKLVIPSHLGYGSRGAPPAIPPNAKLVLEIELVDVK